MDDYTIEILFERLKAYKEFCKSSLLCQKIRRPNFPEDISENIVKFFLKCKNTTPGDLYSHRYGSIEVKCFSSNGPISFGPKEKWDTLVVVDATEYLNDNYILHLIIIDNTSINFKVNKTQSFQEQILQLRRPRITWLKLEQNLRNYSKIFKIRLESSSTSFTVTELPESL